MWKPRLPGRPVVRGLAGALALALVLGPVCAVRAAEPEAAPAQREEPPDPQAIARGRAFADANCAGCHALGPTGASPFAAAPPFRDLHKRYPVDSLAESLAEGIITGHSGMPEFELEPDQIEDFIDYLHSLEPAPAAK